jgi:hypothetical protein
MATDEDYLQFKRRFDQSHVKLKLPPDCVEQTPPTASNVHLYSWMFDWVVVFNSDNKYLRVRESHDKVGGLAHSRRLGFVFHYGPIVQRDVDGNIVWKSGDPLDIRIDTSGGAVHLHYQDPAPHHPQANVKGLSLNSIDVFKFVRAVLQHRRSGKPLNEILGFQIG